jgi:hypothetical protein
MNMALPAHRGYDAANRRGTQTRFSPKRRLFSVSNRSARLRPARIVTPAGFARENPHPAPRRPGQWRKNPQL